MGPDWYQDPTGRHQLRWHDGRDWTDNVADDGATSTDPYRGGGGSAASWPTPDAGTGASAGAGSAGGFSSAPDGGGGGGRVRTGWVVAIALTTLVVGAVLGFFAGLAVDIGGQFGAAFEEGFEEGFDEDFGEGFGDGFDGGGAGLDGASPGAPIELGGQYSGASGDGGTAHELVLDADTTLELETVEADFDTVIELYDGTGALLAEDDDGGTDNRSLLRTDVPAGSYTVVVSPFGGFGGGSYTLAVDG